MFLGSLIEVRASYIFLKIISLRGLSYPGEETPSSLKKEGDREESIDGKVDNL